MSSRDWAARFRPAGHAAGSSDDEEQSRATFTRRPLWMILLAVLAALALAAAVIRITGADLLFDSNSALASSLMPGDPRGIFDRALDDIQFTGTASDKVRREMPAAFDKAPLAEEPLLAAGADAEVHGDRARATRLIEIAHRRDPRSRMALMLLLQQSLRAGRVKEGVATMAVLARLMPQARNLLVAELAQMASEPRTRAAVGQAMAADPHIRSDLLERLARNGASPDLLFGLAGAPAAVPAAGAAPAWQQLMLDKLVSEGRVAEAFGAWKQLSGVSRSPTSGVYDGDFAGLPGPAPFNWATESSGAGLAEIQHGSPGLRVDYYARDQARLASQLLMLSPGRYQLTFRADVQSEGDGGADRLAWTVACNPGGQPLTTVSLRGSSDSKTFSAEFTVPASGCSGQWLRLVGSPAEFPKDQQATITQLRIARVGQ